MLQQSHESYGGDVGKLGYFVPHFSACQAWKKSNGENQMKIWLGIHASLSKVCFFFNVCDCVCGVVSTFWRTASCYTWQGLTIQQKVASSVCSPTFLSPSPIVTNPIVTFQPKLLNQHCNNTFTYPLLTLVPTIYLPVHIFITEATSV